MRLTVRQAAERLGVSAGTVYALCSARRLRHSRVGLGRGKIAISEEAVAEYLKQAEVAPVTAAPAAARGRPAPAVKAQDPFFRFLPPS
jgi:excisionase family DNA binding protein